MFLILICSDWSIVSRICALRGICEHYALRAEVLYLLSVPSLNSIILIVSPMSSELYLFMYSLDSLVANFLWEQCFHVLPALVKCFAEND